MTIGPDHRARSIAMHFYTAAWCGPCIQMRTIFDELVIETRRHLRQTNREVEAESLNAVVVDIDNDPEATENAQIERIPLITLTVDGEEKLRLVGARPKLSIREQFSIVLDN